MTDIGIMYGAPMVRALLAGMKTQTRRLIKPQPTPMQDIGLVLAENPLRFAVGDRLWVREAVRAEELPSGVDVVRYAADDAFIEIANTMEAAEDWGELHAYRRGRGLAVNPRHMPKWASRLTLHVTDVRVQQLQEIDRDDAKAEGVPEFWDQAERLGLPGAAADNGHVWDNHTSVENYRGLWNHIHGNGAWAANPWVAALTFDVERCNIGSARP